MTEGGRSRSTTGGMHPAQPGAPERGPLRLAGSPAGDALIDAIARHLAERAVAAGRIRDPPPGS